MYHCCHEWLQWRGLLHSSLWSVLYIHTPHPCFWSILPGNRCFCSVGNLSLLPLLLKAVGAKQSTAMTSKYTTTLKLLLGSLEGFGSHQNLKAAGLPQNVKVSVGERVIDITFGIYVHTKAHKPGNEAAARRTFLSSAKNLILLVFYLCAKWWFGND